MYTYVYKYTCIFLLPFTTSDDPPVLPASKVKSVSGGIDPPAPGGGQLKVRSRLHDGPCK